MPADVEAGARCARPQRRSEQQNKTTRGTMTRTRLLALLAIGVSALGCAADHSGTYKGEATESGTLKIAVLTAPEVAKNESPPHKIPDASVAVTKEGNGYTVKWGSCTMKGEPPTSGGLVVAKGDCEVKIANWTGSLPLSATLKFGEGGDLSMDVTCTTKEEKRNDVTVLSYDWTFKGKK
jgi:hypothetical protein